MKKILIMEFNKIEADLKADTPYDRALQECICAQKEALRRGDIGATAHASKGIAESYRRLGKINAALLELKTARTLFQEIRDISGTAWTNWASANILRQQCDFVGSINLLSKAYRSSVLVKDFRCVAYSLAGIAETTRIMGNYKISYLQHLSALKIFERLQDYRGIVWAYEGLAQMHKNCGNLCSALKLFDVSRKIAQETFDSRGLGYALKGCGEVLGLMGIFKDAIHQLSLALHIFNEIRFKVGIAYTSKTLGDIYLRSKNIENSLKHLGEAQKVFEELNDRRGIFYVKKSFGDVNKKIHLKDEARALYLDSQKFFREKNIHYGLVLSSMALKNL